MTNKNNIQATPRDSTVTVQQGLVVPANREQEAITISRKEFHFLKNKISNISCKANTFSNLFSADVGICGSAGLSLIPFISDRKKTLIIISVFIIIVTVIAGIIFFLLSKKFKDNDTQTKEDVVNHMNIVEDRFYDLKLK